MRKIVGVFVLMFYSLNTFSADFEKGKEIKDISTEVHQYIHQTWDRLKRNVGSYFKSGAINSLILPQNNILYISSKENSEKVKRNLKNQLSEDEYKRIKIVTLPDNPATITKHGLLYLPYSYVVPGGMFNEMYGWDSYFIELGLLHDGRLDLAKNMVENIIYEINYYGTILNANRTYFLERSHPPLLTQMVLAYYEKTKDKQWLKTTLPAINKLYQYWMSPPRLVPEIGLSRYYAGGHGPTPEELPSYYEKVKSYFKNNHIWDYDKKLYYDEAANKLTDLFYIADRTVRESGFDVSAKFGPFGASILDYVPVDLNVLLYQMEKDTSEIYKLLNDPKKEMTWMKRALDRKKLINQFMWHDSLGYYFDYNFKNKILRPYVYATTFYPLWANIASKNQAARVVNNIPNLLAAGGIVTSTYTPKFQWDAPFGWAPFQYFAVKGLQNYGYNDIAKDIAERFIRTINNEFAETNLIYEKYDVQNLSRHHHDKIIYGYNTNESGFGWTNGVYLELTDSIKVSKEFE